MILRLSILGAVLVLIAADTPATPGEEAKKLEGAWKEVSRYYQGKAVETVIAAISEDDAALTGEAADLLFHLLVLLDSRGLGLADVVAELERREGVSGITEKASRSA